jgi:hypothetical protein
MGEAPGAYRLERLGWLQFQRLCSLVLESEAGLDGLRWHGDADRERWAVAEQPLELPRVGVRAGAPVVLAVAWAHDEASGGELAKRARRILAKAVVRGPGELVVLTNLDGVRAHRALARHGRGLVRRAVVLGAGEIGTILDARAELRAAMPSVLGLRDLEPLIDAGAGGRSSLDVERARALARVFVPTRAYARARTVLGRHRFVVLTGPPEMGKTAIAQMLALAALTDGWEAHDCSSPEDVWRALARERRQVFVADDAFGSTEYRPDAGERWARELPRLLQALDGRHWLIWTSRPAPLRAGLGRLRRERGAERFPAPGEVLVDASRLDLAEKTLILFRHAKARDPAGLRRELVRTTGVPIVEHPHFTPERIRRLVATRLDALPAEGRGDGLLAVLERELTTPTAAMATSFRALGEEHRAVLTALLDAPAGLIDARELAATVRRHHPGGLSRPPAELVDRLSDHFLHVGSLGIGWVHPSWRDLVIDELRRDGVARRRFLGACGLHGALLVLSRAGGVAGERALPLLIGDADWDRFGDRAHDLVRELPDRDVAHLLEAAAAALAPDLATGQRLEAESLGESLAAAARSGWDRRGQPLPVFALEAWFALAARLPAPMEPPELGATWIELHPGSCAPGGDLLSRADDWLALAQTLAEHAPRALAHLGFPDREQAVLEGLVKAASAESEQTEPAERVLARIAQLAPELAPDARGAITGLRFRELEREDRWWAPHDLPRPPSEEPATADPAAFTVAHVARVLRDL